MLCEYSRIQDALPDLSDQDMCPLCEEPTPTPHEKCSKTLTNSRAILPMFFHNLRGYDAHFIMQAVTDEFQKVTCIAQTTEK